MFDVGFSEVLLIAIVALLVLGPERLPKAARFAGLWIRRARGQWDSVRNELERELAAEELKASVERARREAADIARGMQDTGARVQQQAAALETQVREVAAEAAAVPREAPAEAIVDAAPAVPAAAGEEVPVGQTFSLELPLPSDAAAPASDAQVPRHD